MSPPAPLPDRGGGREQRSRRRTEPIEFFVDNEMTESARGDNTDANIVGKVGNRLRDRIAKIDAP